MTEEFWSADHWFDPLATLEDLDRMHSPVGWLNGPEGHPVPGALLNHDFTFRPRGTQNRTEQDQEIGEAGKAVGYPMAPSPASADCWTVGYDREDFLANGLGVFGQKTGENDGSQSFDLPLLTTKNAQSGQLEIGTASRFEATASPIEETMHKQGLPNYATLRRSATGTESNTSLGAPADPRMEEEMDDESDGTQEDTVDDSSIKIGWFQHNGKFKCLQPQCTRKSFNRQAELRRHYDTIHAPRKPEYWCRVASCQRSQANGGYPFPRRDKLRDHMRKVHGRP